MRLRKLQAKPRAVEPLVEPLTCTKLLQFASPHSRLPTLRIDRTVSPLLCIKVSPPEIMHRRSVPQKLTASFLNFGYLQCQLTSLCRCAGLELCRSSVAAAEPGKITLTKSPTPSLLHIHVRHSQVRQSESLMQSLYRTFVLSVMLQRLLALGHLGR